MRILADEIIIEHRMAGLEHVFTSPDVPELYVANLNYETARIAVQSTLDMLTGYNPETPDAILDPSDMIEITDMSIEHRMVGHYHTFTSDDVPGFFVADLDYATALSEIRPMLAKISDVRTRIHDANGMPYRN